MQKQRVSAEGATKIANEEKSKAFQALNKAQAYKLIWKAKTEVEKDPTIALRLAEKAMQINNKFRINDADITAYAYEVYLGNYFYKIVPQILGKETEEHLMSGITSPDGR